MRKLAGTDLVQTPYEQLEHRVLALISESSPKTFDSCADLFPSLAYPNTHITFRHLLSRDYNMIDLDKYEAHVLMHRIAKERNERTPELVERFGKYVGAQLAKEYDEAVTNLNNIIHSIEEVLGNE